jgi:hypothetical protein
VLNQDRGHGFEDSIFFLVGHRRFLLGVVNHFQENLDGPPFQILPPVRAFPRLACARLGQARTGDLQKECCTNLSSE